VKVAPYRYVPENRLKHSPFRPAACPAGSSVGASTMPTGDGPTEEKSCIGL
jgi:hypothetical protein